MKRARLLAIGFVLAGAVAGCANVPGRAGFDDVRRAVADRTGHSVEWNRGTPADAAVADSVRAMLRDELTADEAVQLALLNNARLQATYEDLMVAQADLVAAGLLRNPVFDAEFRFPEGGGGVGIEMAVVQDFIDLLYLPLRKKQAGAAFEAAKLRVAGEVIDLAAEVRTAFYTFQASQQAAEMRRQVAAATSASYDLAQRLRTAGNITELDLANEQALFEQSRLDLRAAEAQTLRDRERLNRLMGLWGEPSASWSAAARLPEIPADEVAFDALERRAVERSLDLQIASREVAIAARAAGVATPVGLLPEAEVGLSAEREHDGGWAVGPAVSLPIPLFDQGQPAVARARSNLRRARQHYLAVAVDVRSRARAAREAVVAAREQAEHYRTVVLPLRGRILEQTQLHYNAMQASPFQLLTAKQQQIDAGINLVSAQRAYWIARTELDQLLQGRLPTTESTAIESTSSSIPAADREGH